MIVPTAKSAPKAIGGMKMRGFEFRVIATKLVAQPFIAPAIGLDAEAYSRFGMRPDRYARRPARTARFMAVAMAAASRASAMAVFIRIASAPSSMAMAASDGTPTPASTMIIASGNCSRIIRKIRRVLHAHSRTDRGGQRHDGGAAGVEQFFCHYQIVGEIRQDDKAFFYQYFSGLKCLFVVGQQRDRIADDLELDPIGFESFAGQSCGADRVVGVVASCGVRQDLHLRGEVVEKRFARTVERHAIDRDRHHLGSGSDMGGLHLVIRTIFARADNEA